LGVYPHSWCLSRSGKISCGQGFVEFGQDVRVGDTVTVEIDMDRDSLRFWNNGVCLGVAWFGVFSGRFIVPAVALGSAEGGAPVRLRVACPCVAQLDVLRSQTRLKVHGWDAVIRCDSKWATGVMAHPGVWEGEILRFACKVRCRGVWFFLSARQSAQFGRVVRCVATQLMEGDGGFAIGVVNTAVFDALTQTLGAADGSWCLSRTGKKGENKTFIEFTDRLVPGDVVGVEVDMRR
jgi:hypothetical protein